MSRPGEPEYGGKGSFDRTSDLSAFRYNFEQINWDKLCPICQQPKPCPTEQLYRHPEQHTNTPSH